MKEFVYKLRRDVGRLFRYPELQTPPDFSINYDLYWNTRGRGGDAKSETLSAWQRERAELAAKHIRQGAIVMDLGSGGGSILEYLREGKGIHPIGVDISTNSLESLREKGIEAICLDISSLEEVATLPQVDYIIGFEILEHMNNPEQLIHILAPKAREGMFFSFPNTGYYVHRFRLLFGRFPLQWVVHPGEHVRFWTVHDVQWWVPQIKMKLEQMVVYQGLPLLKKLRPSLFGEGIFIYLRKLER